MKMSYKIVLALSVLLCAVSLFAFMGKGEPTPTDDAQAAGGQAETPDRKTLRSSPTDTSNPAMAQADRKPPSSRPTSSLSQDVRNRLKAADTPTADAVEDVKTDTPEKAAIQAPAPNAIALTRTDDSATTEPAATTTPPEKTTRPVVSSRDLDAILGSSTKPKQSNALSPVAPRTSGTAAGQNDTAVPGTPTGPAPASTTSVTKDYAVQPGDTFSSIAKAHYGDEAKWFHIAQANPTVDPTRLRVGQELKLPPAETLEATTESVPDGPTGVKSYTIRPGDSLSTVAEEFYNDPTLWRTIYNFNRDKIGPNPNAIQAGMRLKVPPLVKGAQ